MRARDAYSAVPDKVRTAVGTPDTATDFEGSWCIPWAVEADPRLPDPLHRLLEDHFSAWRPPPSDTGPLALVSLLEEVDAQRARDIGANAGVQMLPTAWEGMTVRAAPMGEQAWCLSARGSCCWLQLNTRGPAHIRCTGAEDGALAYVALTEVFRRAGWLTLHASGHAADGGQLRLSLGRSGAGKSWRALTTGLAGAAFVAEDRVWLRESDLLLLPRDRRVRLLPDTVSGWLDADRQRAAVADPDGKLQLPLSALGLQPAAPAPLAELEVLLGACPRDPLDLPPVERAAQRRLRIVQALWEALGVPFTAPAQAITARAVQRLAGLPVTLWWREPHGPLQRCAA